MGQPVVHFEIIGADPERLRDYYGERGWAARASAAACPAQPAGAGGDRVDERRPLRP
jgi:uncharacterized protein